MELHQCSGLQNLFYICGLKRDKPSQKDMTEGHKRSRNRMHTRDTRYQVLSNLDILNIRVDMLDL
jgi:hypothetical protein